MASLHKRVGYVLSSHAYVVEAEGVYHGGQTLASVAGEELPLTAQLLGVVTAWQRGMAPTDLRQITRQHTLRTAERAVGRRNARSLRNTQDMLKQDVQG